MRRDWNTQIFNLCCLKLILCFSLLCRERQTNMINQVCKLPPAMLGIRTWGNVILLHAFKPKYAAKISFNVSPLIELTTHNCLENLIKCQLFNCRSNSLFYTYMRLIFLNYILSSLMIKQVRLFRLSLQVHILKITYFPKNCPISFA